MRNWKYLWPPYRRAQEREMQEELRSIGEMADARELGNLTHAAEEARSAWRWTWLDNLWRDARYAVRVLRRQPSFAAVTVLSLGLGIGANAAIFSLIDRVLWRQLPVRDAETLVMVGNDRSYPTFEQYRDKFGEVLSGVLATTGASTRDLSTGTETRTGQVELVSGEYFPLLGVPMAIGRPITLDDDRKGQPASIAVLSYAYWQRAYGGDLAALGKTLHVGKSPYQIVGVAAPEFFGVTVGDAPDVWLPLSTIGSAWPGQNNWLNSPRISYLAVLGRLQPGITRERASAVLTPLSIQMELAANPGLPDSVRKRIEGGKMDLTPAAQGLSTLRTRFSKPLRVLFAMVAIGLLLVSMNVMGLQMARADERRRELNVRLAIGAGRGRIVRQLMTETLVMAVVGGLLGLALCRPAASAIISLAGPSIQLPVEIDRTMLLFVAGICVASALICGLIPAMRATSTAQSGALQQGSKTSIGGPRRHLVGRGVAAFQLALSMVLIAAAFLFAFSLRRLTTFDTGIARSRLAVIEIDTAELRYTGPQSAALNRRILDRLAGMNGVESVTFSTNGIYSDRNANTQITADGFAPEPGPNRSAFFDRVGPRFFTTLGTRIVAGRDFDDRDTPAAPPVAIVNRQFANYFFAGQNPLGRNIYMTGPSGKAAVYQVAGVVQEVIADLRRPPRRAFYLPQLQGENGMSGASFIVRTRGDPLAAAADFRAFIRSEDTNLRISRIDSADALLNRTLGLDRLIATLSFGFGLLAMILAAVGIYGLLAYQVTRRTSEIGIRMALGATRRLVISLIFREITWVVAAGLAAGLGAALALGKLVSGLVFGLNPGDPVVLVPAAVVLALVAAGAAWLPARRASRLDPMTALRNE